VAYNHSLDSITFIDDSLAIMVGLLNLLSALRKLGSPGDLGKKNSMPSRNSSYECTAPLLKHYDPELDTIIETDASDGVIAGVFSQQHKDGEWHPELQSTARKVKIYTDHKALEYFMTTKRLTARQARWAEALADYHFEIMYRKGKNNGKADALTRRDDEVTAQDSVKSEYRTRAFLSKDQIEPKVLQDHWNPAQRH